MLVGGVMVWRHDAAACCSSMMMYAAAWKQHGSSMEASRLVTGCKKVGKCHDMTIPPMCMRRCSWPGCRTPAAGPLCCCGLCWSSCCTGRRCLQTARDSECSCPCCQLLSKGETPRSIPAEALSAQAGPSTPGLRMCLVFPCCRQQQQCHLVSLDGQHHAVHAG